MFAKVFTTLALVGAALAQNSFSINTPASVVQCQPASISWVGGTAPFILATIPGGQTGAAAISTLSSSLSSSPYTWNVNLASGTYITLKLTDATGNIAYSSPLTVQAGSSSACLDTNAVTSGLSTTGAITTTGSGSATLTATSAVSGTTSTTVVSVSASSVVSASRASSASSAASSGNVASSVSSRVAGSSTSVGSASASAAPSGGAMAGAVAGVPAVAAGVLGAVAFFL